MALSKVLINEFCLLIFFKKYELTKNFKVHNFNTRIKNSFSLPIVYYNTLVVGETKPTSLGLELYNKFY